MAKGGRFATFRFAVFFRSKSIVRFGGWSAWQIVTLFLGIF